MHKSSFLIQTILLISQWKYILTLEWLVPPAHFILAVGMGQHILSSWGILHVILIQDDMKSRRALHIARTPLNTVSTPVYNIGS